LLNGSFRCKIAHGGHCGNAWPDILIAGADARPQLVDVIDRMVIADAVEDFGQPDLLVPHATVARAARQSIWGLGLNQNLSK
jgi:hypothetical protein